MKVIFMGFKPIYPLKHQFLGVKEGVTMLDQRVEKNTRFLYFFPPTLLLFEAEHILSIRRALCSCKCMFM
jgi:hypothetical protein